MGLLNMFRRNQTVRVSHLSSEMKRITFPDGSYREIADDTLRKRAARLGWTLVG